MSDRLYAKGGPSPPTVENHCIEVAETADLLLNSIRNDLELALGGSRVDLAARFRPLLLAAGLLHDVMKANSSFKEMLEGGANRKTQPVRHEILAAILIMQNEPLRKWLQHSLSGEQLLMIAWAVAGHHFQSRLRRQTDRDDPMFRTQNVPRIVTLYLGHPQVSAILKRVDETINGGKSGIAPVPTLAEAIYDTLDEDNPDGLEAAVRTFVSESDVEWKGWNTDKHASLRIELGLMKVLLVAADIGGSALPEQVSDSADWIRDRLSRSLSAADVDAVIQANLNGKKPRRFQEKVAETEHQVTVVTAGCGNGKTTAAYMWAQRHGVGRKLFFTYPTTGTASAGFRDYLFAQSQLERNLIHGRSLVDLNAMQEESPDVPPIERAQRLEALNAWGQQVIACTADTVLGLIQNQRRPVFSFPAIIRGAFVFDEVHSYDRQMFAALLKFLETFPGLPVLIMSASIPPNRLDQLRRVCGDRMNAELIQGDETLEEVQRYSLHSAPREDCWLRLEEFFHTTAGRQCGKVLWVCNTVKAAVDIFHEAQERFPDATILLYHSRYRYGDRVALQERVVDEFEYEDEARTNRKHSRQGIVVATQVCEMSLNISADILVSALCPLPSLVQRLGRLNRYSDEDAPCPAYIYPFSGRPYHEEDAPAHCNAADDLIKDLKGQPCSQQRLGKAIEELQSIEELPTYSAWLDGGWRTEPLPVREGDNSITLVREEDLSKLTPNKSGNYEKDDVIPLTIPMLFQRGFDFTARAAGYPVAPAGTVGYEWDKDSQQGGGAEWRRSN